MIGVDTNVLVRLLTNDDKKQAQYAATLIKNNSVLVSKSVFLEVAWVLRYCYELKPNVILKAFKGLMGIDHVVAEDPACVWQALQWYGNGFDFADALHLASCQKAQRFATLNKHFIKKAKKFNINLLTLSVNPPQR